MPLYSVHANFSNVICFLILSLYTFALVLIPVDFIGIDSRGLEYTMASASVNTQASSKETSNYPRLCRLLVEVGTQVLRETFDKIHPSASLHVTLSSHSVLARLELLYKGKDKILNPTQWEQLYPSNPSSVSSLNFDAILLMVLLRNISGLHPPTSGWGKPPPAKDTSIGAAITRLWVFRNEINDHASKSQIDDLTFEEYWKDIQQTLTRLGGERYGPYIDKLKTDYMDPDIALQYQERLKKWREDEVIIDEIEGRLLHKKYLDKSTCLTLYHTFIPSEVSHVEAHWFNL